MVRLERLKVPAKLSLEDLELDEANYESDGGDHMLEQYSSSDDR